MDKRAKRIGLEIWCFAFVRGVDGGLGFRVRMKTVIRWVYRKP